MLGIHGSNPQNILNGKGGISVGKTGYTPEGGGPPPPDPFNVALASNGSTASASAASINAAPSICINGVRHTNNSWSGNGYASEVTPTIDPPVTFEVDFGTSRTISEIRTYCLSSTLGVNYDVEPDASDTTVYAMINFTVEYWNGSSWTNIDTVTGNDKTLKIFTFSPVVTDAVRISCTSGGDARLFMVEMEAWGY